MPTTPCVSPVRAGDASAVDPTNIAGDSPCFDEESQGSGGDGNGAICFTGDSLLTLQDGSNIKLHDLKVSE